MKRKQQSPAERRRALRVAAMPEVKRLVKKFGRATISSCIGKIRDGEKAAAKLAALKREIATLRKSQ